MDTDIQTQILETMLKLSAEMDRLQANIDDLETRLASSTAVVTHAERGMLSQLPEIDAMRNIEMTVFDNGKSRGRSQYKIKAEVNISESTKFAGKRDFECFADLYDPLELRLKLGKRKISDDYRALIIEKIKIIDQTNDAAWIGMFSLKGGKNGQTWLDKQFVVVYHNGDCKPLYSYLNIGDRALQLSAFDREKNPKTGKAFSSLGDGKSILGKSIDIITPQDTDED